jgi:hypothetical protein
MWDSGHLGFGWLRGHLFQNIMTTQLSPINTIEQCPIPLGVTAFNLHSMTTTHCTSGVLPTAIRASCTFPLLFQPTPVLDNDANCWYHIDGGIFDNQGLFALPLPPLAGSKPRKVPEYRPLSAHIAHPRLECKSQTLPPLIINVLFSGSVHSESQLPAHHSECRVSA